MSLQHSVPAGKVLVLAIGGYRFVGPAEVNLSGNIVLPDTYEDGSPTDCTLAKPVITPMPVGSCPEVPEAVDDPKNEPAISSSYKVKKSRSNAK